MRSTSWGWLALVDAAETAGVARFVYVSYAGVDAGLGTPMERAKLAIEQRLSTSGMQAVVVRPDAFQDVHLTPLGRFDMARGRVAVFGRGDVPQRWVNVDDVAALLAALAVESDPPGLVEVGGPEALSRNAAIEVAARATGRPMKRQAMPLWVARLGMRLLARPNDALASLFGLGVLQDQQQVRWDESPLATRGITPMSASEFIERQARSLP